MKAFPKTPFFKSKFALERKMQKQLIPFLMILLLSCNNGPLKDVRPAEQQSLARVVKELRDEVDKSPMTDPNRPIFIDHGVGKVKSYIVDTLKSQFSGWNARVLDNIMTDPNGGDVRIAFGISIDDFNLQETARYKSIVFRQWLSDAQSPLREKLQELKVGDHVKISGSFVSRDKRIDVDPYNEKEFQLKKNIFSNPEFRVDLTDVTLVKD